MKNNKFFLIFAVLLLVSCNDLSIDHHKNQTPELNFKDAFTGERVGYGFIENWRGEIVTTFTAKFVGVIEDSKLIISEKFLYSSGEEDERVVELDFADEHQYVATCEDFDGPAQGFEIGNAALFNYNLKLKEGKVISNVKANEQFVLLEDGTIFADSKLKKFGIKVGKVVMYIKKKTINSESYGDYKRKKIAVG